MKLAITCSSGVMLQMQNPRVGLRHCLIGVGGWVVGLRSPMYTRHCIYTFMVLATAVCPQSPSSVFTERLEGLCQRCYVNILPVVHIILILLFFYQRLEILETDQTLQSDLTGKDILPFFFPSTTRDLPTHDPPTHAV